VRIRNSEERYSYGRKRFRYRRSVIRYDEEEGESGRSENQGSEQGFSCGWQESADEECEADLQYEREWFVSCWKRTGWTTCKTEWCETGTTRESDSTQWRGEVNRKSTTIACRNSSSGAGSYRCIAHAV
jgi:hypothetical protein